jgi:hypothetical protein
MIRDAPFKIDPEGKIAKIIFNLELILFFVKVSFNLPNLD